MVVGELATREAVDIRQRIPVGACAPCVFVCPLVARPLRTCWTVCYCGLPASNTTIFPRRFFVILKPNCRYPPFLTENCCACPCFRLIKDNHGRVPDAVGRSRLHKGALPSGQGQYRQRRVPSPLQTHYGNTVRMLHSGHSE